MNFRLKWISILCFSLLSFAFAAGVQFDRESNGDGFRKFYFSVQSSFLNNKKIPVFVYTAPERQGPLNLVLFLHGKGFSRGIKSEDGMLDYANLKDFYQKEENRDVVFISPQDTFYHKDNGSAGHDYWIGKEGRNWPKFLGEDLDSILPLLKEKLGSNSSLSLYKVLGISMGAHGAISMGRHYPEKFTHIFALSPVFRPIMPEIPETDRDVFQPENKSFSNEMNMGYQILNNSFTMPKNLYLHISKSDFALDPGKFPNGIKCWDNLKEKIGNGHHLKIHDDGLGHTMNFWKKILFTLPL